MYSVSSGFLTNIKDANILKKGRVIIGSTTLDESYIVYFKIDESFGSGNRPAVGGVAAAKLTLELINTGTLPTIVGQSIKPAVAIDVNGSYEWVELGVFYPEQNDVKLNPDGLSYTIECFDILAKLDRQEYATSISFPATLSSFLSDISTNYSLTFETQTLPSVSITNKPSGTVRQVLGEVASLISRNITLSRSSAANIGKLKFVFSNSTSFSIDGNSYYDLTLLSENSISISKLVLEGQDLYSGTSSGYTLSFSNSQVTTQAELDTVYNRFFPFEYTPFILSSYGFPHLETGDLISITDNENVTRTLLICGHSFLYDGGFESALFAEIANDTEYSSSADGGSSIVNTVNTTVNRATELITGNKGGYVTTVLNNDGKPEELVISDTADYKTASRVWRWNQNGLGYSSTGYNGSYDLAMTSDGQIVADFIKTGKLSTANWDVGQFETPDSKIDIYKGVVVSTTQYANGINDNGDPILGGQSELLVGQRVYNNEVFGAQSIEFSELTNKSKILSASTLTSPARAKIIVDGNTAFSSNVLIRVKNLANGFDGIYTVYSSYAVGNDIAVEYLCDTATGTPATNSESYMFIQASTLDIEATGITYKDELQNETSQLTLSDGSFDLYANKTGTGTGNISATSSISVNTNLLDVNGQAEINGKLTLNPNNAQPLDLVGVDHTFVQFYPQGKAAGRKAFLGFGGAGTTILSISSTAGLVLSGTTVQISGTASTTGTFNPSGLLTANGGISIPSGQNISGAGVVNTTGAITTSGNISTSGTGTITSAGILTASNGFTMSAGALSLPNNSITSAMIDTLDASNLTGTVAFARLPIDSASGTLNFSGAAGGVTSNLTITFPASRFSSAPYLSSNVVSTNPLNWRTSIAGITTTGATFYLYNVSSHSGVAVHWLAIRE